MTFVMFANWKTYFCPMFFYFKALHIIGFVSWFAGLFYLVRLFVYHVEAEQKSQPERDILKKQFNLMEWKLFKIITNPAMIITVFFGSAMLFLNPAYLSMDWMQIKLGLLVLLIAYHFYCKRIIRNLENETNTLTSFQLRLLNEVPTLFLASIVLFAVVKNGLNYGYVLAGFAAFCIFLYFAAKAYKKKREAQNL
jgi:protoporphyrinogen IX oxidase